jgi:hypothetical protein
MALHPRQAQRDFREKLIADRTADRTADLAADRTADLAADLAADRQLDIFQIGIIANIR